MNRTGGSVEATVIVDAPIAVVNELASLGIEEADLREALRAADLIRGTFTPHHPNYYTGIAPQAETVKELSDLLAVKGWSRKDVKNSPRIVSPDGMVAIAVNSGDAATGLPQANPRTRSSKGATTKEDIARNAAQGVLFEVPLSFGPRRTSPRSISGPTTWFLLFYAEGEEIRCELSLPISWDEDEHPNAWRKRILLSAVPTGPEPRVEDASNDDDDEIDVPVTRKTT